MVGRIEKIPLREVWKKEAKDFTTWLYDNLEVLGEEIGLDLTADEKEKRVGSFSADITAEDNFGRKVVIENQLEATDHTHLGQILTYVANLEAKVAVWVTSNPKPEHETAIEWLNEAGADVHFFLVRIEAYKIGDSEPAAKFTVISGPSEKTQIVGEERKELADRHKIRLEFWTSLLEKAKTKTPIHQNRSPVKDNWISAGSGKSGLEYVYAITKERGQVELYIDYGKGYEKETKQIFEELHSHKTEIEESFGESLEWQLLEDRRASRIRKVFDYAGVSDRDKWDQLQNDLIEAMIRLEKAFKKHIKGLKI